MPTLAGRWAGGAAPAPPDSPNLSKASAMAWFFTMSMRPRPRQKWGKTRKTFFRTRLMSLSFCGAARKGVGGAGGASRPPGGTGRVWGLTWSTKSSSTKVATLPLMPMKRLMHVRAT